MIAAAALWLSPSTVAHAAALELQPSSEWSVVRQGDRCNVARQFGEGRNAVVLMLDKFNQGERFLVSLAGHPLILPAELPARAASPGPGNLPYRLRFRPTDEGFAYTLAFGGKDQEDTPYLVLGDADLVPSGAARAGADGDAPLSVLRDRAAEERSARQVLLDQPLQRDLVLHTGPMNVPMITVRACMDAVVRSWGLDPRQQEALVSRPQPTADPRSWIKSYDFPKKPLYRGESAVVAVRLLVDQTGKPTACAIQLSSVPAEFGQTSCQTLIERGRFEPARDAQGLAHASYYTTAIRWVNSG